MRFITNGIEINTNLAEKSFEQLQNGTYKIGVFSDNPGINNEDNDNFYTTEKYKNKTFRTFRNKVKVKLLDGSIINAHIIHWHPSRKYFCITTSLFWDQFDKIDNQEDIPKCPSTQD